MDVQMTSDAQNLQTKQVTASFVHDVADMEVRAFSMREAAKKVREEAKQERDNKEWEIHNLERNVENIHASNKHICEYRKKKFPSYSKFFLCGGAFLGWIIPLGIGIFIATMFTMSAYSAEKITDDHLIPVVMFWMFSGIYGFSYGLPLFISSAKKYKRLVAEYEQKLQENHMILATVEPKLAACKEAFRIYVNETFPKILARADRLEADAALVEKKLQECYALKIIQPAYQKLVCAVILDEIFSNDKADTMREAMLLCDTEIRHADIMVKMDEVIDALHRLSYQLHSMSSVLDSINTNVGLISQDVYSMRGNQEQMAYSIEAIRQSTQNVDSYIAQRRAGAL